MHITEVRIRQYRNFMNARFAFKEGVNTLVGENGAGKTNIFQALRILLDENLPRNAIYLRETDFCRSLDDWRGHWVIISVDFADLDPSEGCQLLKHDAGHMNASGTGTHTFFFRPKFEVRKQLFDLFPNGAGGSATAVTDLLATLTIDDYEPYITGRATADFLDDGVYAECVGDFENRIFPDPEDDDQNKLGVKMDPILPEITCTFIKALRDVVAELKGYKGNPLLTLLRGLESSIQITDSQRISGTVDALNKDIASLQEIKNLSSGIQTSLRKAVGHTFSPEISIESSLPSSIDKLLQRLSVLVGDQSGSKYKGELYEQSLGSANLIYLALKFLEYERKLSSDRVAHFLFIEEPEAHLHTHIQKTLFTKLKDHQTQVIVSTHSTHISSASKISSVNVLAKQASHAEVYQPAKNLDPMDAERVERYLDAVRSTLLFARGVVLVEGQAELVMIPSMVKAVFGMGLDELGISVVSMNSAFFKHISIIFDQDRIHRPCAIVTDLDASLIDLPEDPDDDNEKQKHARAAQVVGEQRRGSLNEFTADNPWIDAFLADHTFEVDFIGAGNSLEAVEVLSIIYTRPASIKTAKEKLESEDIQIAGAEILRLANKEGKGWFALLLSETLYSLTYIPEYILRALAFASKGGISPETLKQMGLFRCAGEEYPEELKTVHENIADWEKLEPPKFISQYRLVAPEDQLSIFCSHVEELWPE